MTVSKQALLDFSKEIESLFLDGKIKSPIHLSKGNEDALIEIFKHVKADDWVFSNHRSHYHALLKGISVEKLRYEILANRSIHINDAGHNFFSSAIVGGCLPIALGIALAFKRSGFKNRCWVFVGDMAAETGSFHECTKYAARNDLPITFVVEDNSLSTNTPTQEAWGMNGGLAKIIRYEYKRGYPHQGVGKWVTF